MLSLQAAKKNRLRRMSLSPYFHIGVQTPEFFPGDPNYVDPNAVPPAPTEAPTDATVASVGSKSPKSTGILTKRTGSPRKSKSKTATIVDLSAEAALNRASPHLLSQPFIGYIRQHEKLLGREVGIMKVAVREFKGLYEAVAAKVAHILNTMPAAPVVPAVPAGQNNTLHRGKIDQQLPDSSSVRYNSLLAELRDMKQLVDDGQWMFDPASFASQVSADPLRNPIDVAAQSRLLDSYLLAHQDAKATQSPEVQQAMDDLLHDLQVRRDSSGGWQALLYRTDGSVDLDMDLGPWNSPAQVAILKEKLDFVKSRLAEQERVHAAQTLALQTELLSMGGGHHPHSGALAGDSDHDSEHSAGRQMGHRKTTGGMNNLRISGRSIRQSPAKGRHSLTSPSPSRNSSSTAVSRAELVDSATQKDDTGQFDNALRITHLETALADAHSALEAITATLSRVQMQQERDLLAASAAAHHAEREAQQQQQLYSLMSPAMRTDHDPADNDHLSHASREILQD